MHALCRIILLAAVGLMIMPAAALDLQANITSLNTGSTIWGSVVVRGTAFNGDAEAALIDGGLRAYYYKPTVKDAFGLPLPVADAPQAGELQQGYNSEFIATPLHSGDWLQDDPAGVLRSSFGKPDAGTGVWLPPYLMRKYLKTNADGTVDRMYDESFGMRMTGKIVIPAGGATTTFGGWADDCLRVTINGKRVYDNCFSREFNGQVTLPEGEHGIMIEFIENGGGQGYGLGGMPAGATFKANGEDSHIFNGRVLEYGRTFREQRPGLLTIKFRNNANGSGDEIGTVQYYRDGSTGAWGNDVGPSPQADSYRAYLAGYWYCPQEGDYEMTTGEPDDLGVLAVSNNEADDPWAITRVADCSDEGSEYPTTAVVHLTAGWKPIRFEFGEGGGGATWGMQWRPVGGSWSIFTPDQLKSTADAVYDWTTISAAGDQLSTEGILGAWDVPAAYAGETIQLRLRTYGTDMSFSEEIVDVLVKKPGQPGDANFDGKCDFADYLILESSFGNAPEPPTNADFDGSGVVDFADYLILEANYGAGATVPEPVTLSMLALGGLALLRRRK